MQEKNKQPLFVYNHRLLTDYMERYSKTNNPSLKSQLVHELFELTSKNIFHYFDTFELNVYLNKAKTQSLLNDKSETAVEIIRSYVKKTTQLKSFWEKRLKELENGKRQNKQPK